jgi:hypothetical protein
MWRTSFRRLFVFSLLAGALLGASPLPALGQAAPQAAAAPAPQPGELEALVAPIALYPDQLLAKVLIASTYPLEIVEAARWRQQNKNLSGSALDSALASQTWDDSIKDLTRTPEVLDNMDKQVSWTQKLGDAVLNNQADVMAAVQRLRAKAEAKGTLTNTAEQKVVTDNQTIIIEPAQPEKVYVPYYDSASVYGPWDWGYPAYAWPPPYGYAYGAGLGFVTGVAIGAAFWNNNFNWGGGNMVVNNFNNFNNINNRTNIRNGQNWQHNVNHRRGVNYGNQALRDRYGRGQMAGADARRNLRGFGEGGGLGDRNGIGNRGGIGDRGGVGNRGGLGDRGGLADRGGLGGNNLGGNRGNFANAGLDRGGFTGLGNGGQTRSFSNRGGASLGSARASGFGGGGRFASSGGGGRSFGGGGMRGGGGGMRGGGGRRR